MSSSLANAQLVHKRMYFNNIKNKKSLPKLNLIEIQNKSFEWFKREGLGELLAASSPISDFNNKLYELSFGDYYFDEPSITPEEAKATNATYEATIRLEATLKILSTGEERTQELYFGDYPIITKDGTFIVNGIERVVTPQLHRCPGVLFSREIDGQVASKIVPSRGAWIEFEINRNGLMTAKIDKKRRILATILLKAFGLDSNTAIKALFKDLGDAGMAVINKTLEKDHITSRAQALTDVFTKLRPGDKLTADGAMAMLEGMFFDGRRYDLSRVGRYKFAKRFDVENNSSRVLSLDDLLKVAHETVRLYIDPSVPADDIDALYNRRLRTVGELTVKAFRSGMLRMERIARDRMTMASAEEVMPVNLVNVRPVMAAVREFFNSSQLSQFMDQTNPLSEIANKRRITALGPGGLSRERAGFEVRDVHPSHYGRICPVETPEGPNIGLVSNLCVYARVNDFGFIETPYFKVKNKVVTDEIEYLDAYDELKAVIAQSTMDLDSKGKIIDSRVSVRTAKAHAEEVDSDEVTHMDITGSQIVGVSGSLVPFFEHNASRRNLMASNMQRQAVPPLITESPIVGTGMERLVGESSSVVVVAEDDGVVKSIDANHLTVGYSGGKSVVYHLQKFVRSNQGVAIQQYARFVSGDKFKKGDVLVDGFSTIGGELSLGQNVSVAFMSFNGLGFEDSIILSERVVSAEKFSSLHIETHKVDVRDTKLGAEQVTRDIPNASEDALKDLDENGIIRIGADVRAGSILVGKITPKGESELSAEERLLRAIFGEKAREVRDTSLRLPNGESGKVIDVKVFSGKGLPKETSTGVLQEIHISVAQWRKISIGDKMAGRHGNKGVVSRILPVEDMPYDSEGNPVDIILNPLGIISRMNIGQVMETYLGGIAHKMNIKVATPVFDGISLDTIKELAAESNLDSSGKVTLYDGKSGKPFDDKVFVGQMYMLKLSHMVDDKMHTRSTGPYAMVTQQPIGGKSLLGGQRFGEMEVWALEAYGAAYTLQEMLTTKSDDVIGRSKAFESMIKNEPISGIRVPESFKVLIKELEALCLTVTVEDSFDAAQVDSAVLVSESTEMDIDSMGSGDTMDGEVDGVVSDDEAQGLSEQNDESLPSPVEVVTVEETIINVEEEI